jgi:hypothetical protein
MSLFNDPSFKKMLEITSHATQDVTLPLPKKTCTHIVHMFKQQMYLLKKCLNVCIDTYCVLSF